MQAPIDPYFPYVRLALETLVSWPVLALAVVVLLVRNPRILERIASVDVAGVKVEMKELRRELADSRRDVEELKDEVAAEREMYLAAIGEVDVDAPVGELVQTREALKARARTLQDPDLVPRMLTGADRPEEVYGAAIAIRAKPRPEYFRPAVACLERLAGDPDLKGVRLNFVWTLVKAVHEMLIQDLKHAPAPQLPRADLEYARSVLQALRDNPRIVDDRPEQPDKGVRGPIRWALRWIDKGLS